MRFALVPALMLTFGYSVDAPATQLPPPPARPVGGPNYAARDGKAEALAELSSGGPVQLYFGVYNGVAPGFWAPGLPGCNPLFAKPNEIIFHDLPEIDISEASRIARFDEAALQFAKTYNVTMYKEREAQIKHACPSLVIAQ